MGKVNEGLPDDRGPGVEHTLMVAAADTRKNPEAAEVVARFRAQGYKPPGFAFMV